MHKSVSGFVGVTIAMSTIAMCMAMPAAAQTIDSVYTEIDLKKCRQLQRADQEAFEGSWRCRGHAGIVVYYAAGDSRDMISFGPRAKDEPAATQTLPAFNSGPSAIEWRRETLPGSKPKAFATIGRWSTSVPDPNSDKPEGGFLKGQVLVVTRLGPGGVCHVGYVDARANTDANALAQKIADTRARAFRCGTDKAVVDGKTGPGFSAPVARE